MNHQIDPQLMMTLGQEFARLFKDAGVTRVLTAEASGIAPGIMAAYCLGVPMVFARKKKPQPSLTPSTPRKSSPTPSK